MAPKASTNTSSASPIPSRLIIRHTSSNSPYPVELLTPVPRHDPSTKIFHMAYTPHNRRSTIKNGRRLFLWKSKRGAGGIPLYSIKRLDDGRRVALEWVPIVGFKPFDYTLLTLEEAQKRKDIVFRAFPRPHS